MKTPFASERGALLVSMLWVSLVITIMVMAISSNLWRSASMTQAIVSRNRATYVAESGLQDILNRLSRTPEQILEDLAARGSITTPWENLDGQPAERYQITLTTTSQRMVVRAEVRGESRDTRQMIEALIRLENIGDYFAAAAGTLRIAFGTQAYGKVYGTRVIFEPPLGRDGVRTFIDTLAHYVNEPIQPRDYLTFVSTRGYVTEPVPLNFPPVDPATLEYYRVLAGTAVYTGEAFTRFLQDQQGQGNVVLRPPPSPGQPVYFVNGDCVIPHDWRFQGRFLIVASGTITLQGNLTREYDLLARRDQDGQVVQPRNVLGLITPKDVIVHVNNEQVPENEDITIHAFVYAPEGTFKAVGSTRGGSLRFEGGIIVKTEPQLARVFPSRVYTYDTRLRTPGLPHLPYRAEIIHYRTRATERRRTTQRTETPIPL